MKTNTEPFRSYREYKKVDCNAFRYQSLQVSYYDGEMANGKLLLKVVKKINGITLLLIQLLKKLLK